MVTAVNDVFKRAKALFGREEPESQTAIQRKKVALAFHAVTIVSGRHACTAARQLAGKRFLSREAPVLPLKDCNSEECECRYEHHEDRRIGPRRARELGVAIDGYEGDEKRAKVKRGRRNTDR